MNNSLKKLYSLFERRDKKKIFFLLAAMVVSALLEVVGIGSIPLFLSLLLSPEKISQFPVINQYVDFQQVDTNQLLVGGSLVLLAIFLLKNTYNAWLEYYKARFTFAMQHNLRQRLFGAYFYAPYTFHLNRNPSDILHKVNAEVRMLIINILMPGLKIILNGLLTLSIFLLLVFTDAPVTLITFSILLFASWLFFRLNKKKMHDYGHQEKKYRALMVKQVAEALGGLKITFVLRKRDYFFRQFVDASVQTSRAGQYNETAKGLTRPFVEMLAVVGIVLIIFILKVQNESVEAITAILTLYGVSLIKMMPSLRQVLTEYTSLRYNHMLVDPLYDDLRQLEGKKAGRVKSLARTSAMPFHRAIQLQDITFRYPEAKTDALRNITLTIPKGQSIALVGATGAGKTTLVDLLLGLVKPTAGQVLIDGADMHTDLPAWLQNVGYVPQEIYLADDTIARNIAFGYEDDQIDQERLQSAVENAQLTEVIRHLPDGLATTVGDRGVRLSGGQRQRIGIARALYHRPEVLIMDEGTSALDNTTEKYIMHSINQLRKNYTIITIAHRLSTIKDYDTIYFLKNGEIVSSGTYDTLAETSEEFHQMSLS